MKRVRVEDFKDYKAFLVEQIEVNRHLKGYQTKLGRAAGCHPSYISQVIKSAIQLTPDHGAGLARFWQLDEIETRYFLGLIQLGRAGTPELRKVIQSSLEEIKTKHFSLANRLKVNTSDVSQNSYYNSWVWAAVHVFLGIPEFQTKEKIRERLNLPEDLIDRVLLDLKQMGLAEYSNNKWTVTNKATLLPQTSQLIGSHLQNWRTQALLSAIQGGNEKIHYSALHALSKKDSETLRQMVVTFIEQTRALAHPSDAEIAVCINLDFFPL